MKLYKSQSGIAHLTIIGLILILSIVGFTGWRVWQVRQDNKKSANQSDGVSQSMSNSKPKEKTEDKNKLPDGFVEYTNQEYGFKFAYPKEWGEVAVQKEPGYTTYTYDSEPKSTGAYGLLMSFSLNKDVAASMYNSKLVSGPHGGSTLYGVLGFCESAGSYSLKYTATKTTSGSDYTVDTAKCSDEKLNNVTKASQDKGIYISKLKDCGVGDCNALNALIVTTPNDTFSALIIKSASLSQEAAEKIAGTVK